MQVPNRPREIQVAADKTQKTSPFDPQAVLEAQRRNFEALTNAGQIVADGMRTYAERQVAMVQDTMHSLWSELQASTQKPQATAAAPADQFDRMRTAFEKVMAQVQELGNLLLKIQTEAIQVLNDCATRNFEAMGGAAPELADLQKKAHEAFETATRQTTAVVDEMKKRMASLETEAKSAASAPPPASPSPSAPPAEASAPAEASTGEPESAPAAKPSSPRARRASASKASDS